MYISLFDMVINLFLCVSLTELEQKVELSLRQSDVNSKSKKKAQQLQKRTSKETDDLELAKKKPKTEEASEEEEEAMVSSSSESPESSEEEDDEITIQQQHPRLATKIGFIWEPSDNITENHSSDDSSDENEPMDETTEVKLTMCAYYISYDT